ncbi:ABC transporter permease [Aquifex pyrophilus]
MRTYLKIALRYLLSSRGASLIISLIAFFGIFLSVSAILLTIGVFTGFQDELKNKILSKTPHIVITLYTDEEEKEIRETLSKIKEVKNFLSFKLYNAFLSSGRVVQSVSVKAIDFSDKNFRSFIEKSLVEGELKGLVIGKGIAEILGVSVGEKVSLVSPFGIRTPTGVIPKVKSYRIGGIFYTGSYDKDFAFVFMDLKEAMDFFKRDVGINLTEVYLKEPYNANRVKERILKELGNTVIVRSWIDLNKPLFNALELEKLGLFFILLLMVLVASFNITSLLFVKVKERLRDIAVFKTFGMKKKGIVFIFLSVGMSLGILGALLGIINAYVLAYFINEYKLIRVSEEVYMMSYIPVHIKLKDVIATFTGTVVLSFLSSLLPSLRASSERVIEVLRKE